MTRKFGREGLAVIGNGGKFKCFPVIVLDSSSVEQDIANVIESFWFTNVTLPSNVR